MPSFVNDHTNYRISLTAPVKINAVKQNVIACINGRNKPNQPGPLSLPKQFT